MTNGKRWIGAVIAGVFCLTGCQTGSGSGPEASAGAPAGATAIDDTAMYEANTSSSINRTDMRDFRRRSQAMLSQDLPERVEEYAITQDGLRRPFLVYTPRSYQPGNAAVLLLHGGAGSMRKNFFYPASARWKELAERDGFLLLSPNGVNPRTGDAEGDFQTWNGLRPGQDGRRSQADDVAYLEQVVAWSIERKEVDRDRIYTVGASNGGEMVHRLLIERPQLFAAGVSNISNLPANKISDVERPTPIMILNGTADPLMPYEGGPVRQVAEPVRSVGETLSYWISMHELDRDAAETTRLPDADPDDGCRIVRTAYRGAPDAPPPVVFYRVEGGGHSVPFPSKAERPAAIRRLLGNACHDADGTALAWAFMRRHARAGADTAVSDREQRGNLR